MLKLSTATPGKKQVSRYAWLRACFSALLLTLATANYAVAQASLNGATPSGLAPGAPAGSYALGAFDNVNLFNGNLNTFLPLVKVGGRGDAETTIGLPIDQKWKVESYYDSSRQEEHFYPTSNWWTTAYEPTYAVSTIEGRSGGLQTKECNLYNPPDLFYVKTLTRLTFTALDGTEYELRDTLNGGQPLTVPLLSSQCPAAQPLRGKVFITADGTSATFISDENIYDNYTPGDINVQPSGYLLLRDGTRYRFNSGTLSWVRDRNGNRLTFDYTLNVSTPTTTITDSLNRQVTVERDANDATYGVCDRITYKGFGGTPRTIYLKKTSLSNALRSGGSIQTYYELFPELDAASPYTPFDPPVINSIWLPDGKRYQLLYNNYGELARIELPTGGAIEYDYTAGLVNASPSGVVGGANGYAIYRRVIERRVYTDGATLEYKMTYSRPEGYGFYQEYVETDTRDASNNLLARQRHYFHGGANRSFSQTAIDYSNWREGREYKTEVFDFDGTSLLRRTEQTWEQRAPVAWWTGSPDDAPPNDPRITQTVSTLADSGQVARQSFAYDQYNNQTDVYEYHYGNGAAGGFARRTHTDYLTTNPVNGADYAAANPDANSIHIRALPTEKWTSSDLYGNNKTSLSRFEYDNYSGANRAQLIDRSYVVGHDSASYGTGRQTRGNVTAVTGYSNASDAGSAITAYSQYDILGNVVKTIDAKGNASTIDYTDNFGFPDADARANNPPGNLGGQSTFAFARSATNAFGFTIFAQFDYFTGASVNTEDLNGVVSKTLYNDALDRPTQSVTAVGTASEIQSRIVYDDANRRVETSSDLNTLGDNLIRSESFYDGLGRSFETHSFRDGDYVAVKTRYDALGRVWRVTNLTGKLRVIDLFENLAAVAFVG